VCTQTIRHFAFKANLQTFICSKLEVEMFINGLNAKLNVAGGIYISCNIFTAVVQMMGVCWVYTMCLNLFFLTFQRNVLPPPPSWGHTIFSSVTVWGREEGHFRNSQIPYLHFSLSCSCDCQIPSNLSTWPTNFLPPLHLSIHLYQFSHPVLEGSMYLQNVKKYKLQCVV
jgi:hypothetical protein